MRKLNQKFHSIYKDDDMYKFLTAVLIVFAIWGFAQHRKTNNTYERKIADLEYVIQSGEYCVSACVEQFEKFGC